MKLMWLGQAGYRLEASDGTAVVIDPYMSDSLRISRGGSYTRQVPINEEILHKKADILVLTHIHEDHMNFDTIDAIIAENEELAILSPLNVQLALRQRYADKAVKLMQFDRGVQITLSGLRFTACFACHSDEKAIGFIVEGEGKTLIHTGDTMYHLSLPEAYPKHADALMISINGQGNNMNAVDAARLTKQLAPKAVYPMHWDMFKAYGCDVSEFTDEFENSDNIRIMVPDYYEFENI